MRNYIMTSLLLSSTFTAIAHSSPLPAPQIIAHRAGTADAPENTFPAISKALANALTLSGLHYNFLKTIFLYCIAPLILRN